MKRIFFIVWVNCAVWGAISISDVRADEAYDMVPQETSNPNLNKMKNQPVPESEDEAVIDIKPQKKNIRQNNYDPDRALKMQQASQALQPNPDRNPKPKMQDAPKSARRLRLDNELREIEAAYLTARKNSGVQIGSSYSYLANVIKGFRRDFESLCGPTAAKKYAVVQENCDNLTNQMDELSEDLDVLNDDGGGISPRENFLMNKKIVNYRSELRRLTFMGNRPWENGPLKK